VSLRVAVFASGGGSNLQSLLNRLNGPAEGWGRVVLVVSDRPGIGALARAEHAGIATSVVPVRSADPESGTRILDTLEGHDIDFVALAGYLRLVPQDVIARFRGRITNIHPALLPAFGGPGMYGIHVHEAVLAAGCQVSGATVHHVTERFDEGRSIAQWPVPVRPDDSPAALAARVLRVEHVLYPLALEKLALDSRAISMSPVVQSSPAAFAWSNGDDLERSMRIAFGLDLQE
jgi:phosphoribosylglycinamide formyltransferase 1